LHARNIELQKNLENGVANWPDREQPNSACAVETDPLELKGDQRITELENRFAVEFLAHLSLMEWEHIGATEDCPPHFLDSSKVSSPTGSAKTCEYCTSSSNTFPCSYLL
jgi:hypothetical protein